MQDDLDASTLGFEGAHRVGASGSTNASLACSGTVDVCTSWLAFSSFKLQTALCSLTQSFSHSKVTTNSFTRERFFVLCSIDFVFLSPGSARRLPSRLRLLLLSREQGKENATHLLRKSMRKIVLVKTTNRTEKKDLKQRQTCSELMLYNPVACRPPFLCNGNSS